MKVLHICTSLEGGAGICASRIINATRAIGVNVRVLVASGNKKDGVDIVMPEYPWSRCWLMRIIQALQEKRGKWPFEIVLLRRINAELRVNNKTATFTSPRTLYKNLANHPWTKEADLIHLHWIGNFVDYESFFKNMNKPIIWTIHDENPGLGGFHYTMWKNEANDCLKKLDDELMLVKERAYSYAHSLTLVALSTMMRDFFLNNQLLSKFHSVIINNGIEADKFTLVSKSCAREALSLPESSKVFLFVSYNIHEDRKGLKVLIEALELLRIPNTILLCLGNYDYLPETSFKVRCEGFISNNRIQSLYYSAADLFLMPSYQEAFAQTPMEAMACGTPVVSFPCSGATDLINATSGVVCSDFTVASLIEAIHVAMNRKYKREDIREYVLNNYSYDKIGKQYKSLYESLLGQKSATSSSFSKKKE
jgi:glycosyltransferase involved in cell wall biosynthesis